MTANFGGELPANRHDNKWPEGECNFSFVLPMDQRGSVGCRLISIIVDSAVGSEICLLVTEDPDFVAGYASISPVNLIAHTGLVATPHGPVAFIVWQIAARSSAECFMEHFLNPGSQKSCDMVEQMSRQTHLKLIIIDNQSSDVSVFVDFENTFGCDELMEAMRAVSAPNDEALFADAVDHVISEFDIVGAVAKSAGQASQP